MLKRRTITILLLTTIMLASYPALNTHAQPIDECGKWSAKFDASEKRVHAAVRPPISLDECASDIRFTNTTKVLGLLGGYSLGLEIASPTNIDSRWLGAGSATYVVTPLLHTDLFVAPVRPSNAVVRINAAITPESLAVDTALFILKAILAPLPGSCLIPIETLASVAAELAFLVMPVAERIASGDSATAMRRLTGVFGEFVSASVYELSIECAADFLAHVLVGPQFAAATKVAIGFITWVGPIIAAHVSGTNTPNAAIVAYTVPMVPTPTATLTPIAEPTVEPTPKPDPPIAPSDLRAYLHGGQGIVFLSWKDNSNDEVSFRVLEKLADGLFLQLAEVDPDTTSAEISMLDLREPEYCLIVIATNAAEVTSGSNWICFTDDLYATSVDTSLNIRVDLLPTNQVLLSWDDYAGSADFFQIWHSLMHLAVIGTTTTTSFAYDLPGDGLFERQCFNVSAVSGLSIIESSESLCIEPQRIGPPPGPSNLSITYMEPDIQAQRPDGFLIEWNDNSDNEHGFTVHRADPEYGTGNVIVTTGPDVTSVFLTYQEIMAQSFCVDVIAFNDNGTSPPASEVDGEFTCRLTFE